VVHAGDRRYREYSFRGAVLHKGNLRELEFTARLDLDE